MKFGPKMDQKMTPAQVLPIFPGDPPGYLETAIHWVLMCLSVLAERPIKFTSMDSLHKLGIPWTLSRGTPDPKIFCACSGWVDCQNKAPLVLVRDQVCGRFFGAAPPMTVNSSYRNLISSGTNTLVELCC